MGDFTASETEKVAACPPSVVLDQVLETGEDAERGTEIHAFNKRVLNGMRREDALALVPKEWRVTCAGIDFKKATHGTHSFRCEVSYAIDVVADEALELGVELGRKYPRTDPHVIVGTIDIDAVRADGVPVLSDWKTGYQLVTPAKDNMQLLFFARAKQLMTGAGEIEGRILYVSETGQVEVDRHVFTTYELDRFGDILAETVERVARARTTIAAGQPVTVRTGDHCRYCAALPTCPAYTALARTMVKDLENIEDRIHALTPIEAGAAWVKMKAIGDLLARVETGLKAYARRVPLPAGYRKEVREITFPKKHFIKQRALELLAEKGATPAEIASCEQTKIESQIRVLNTQGG